jgi:hypothetical protein
MRYEVRKSLLKMKLPYCKVKKVYLAPTIIDSTTKNQESTIKPHYP